ncbi:MAG TPA: radical SAM protein [Candidatus Nanoarchaeia archaeon]|nr:radical SAM protein [Candidatus Nanoarchaeia archaeon]
MREAHLGGYDFNGFKVLFVFPNLNLATNLMPEKVTRYSKPDSPHYGIAQLAAVLKENNASVKVLDMRLGYGFDDLLKIVDSFQPDMIGITLIATRIKLSYAMVDRLKELYPRIYTVAGGTHVASFKEKVFRDCKGLDFAVKREGELTFLQLIDAVRTKETDYSFIKGLIFKKDGAVVETEDMPMIDDLDALPLPAYDMFELEHYYAWQRGVVPIVTSRGCPFRCVFCSINLTMGYKFRTRTPSNVVDELEYWYQNGMKRFDINDDEFSFFPKRVEEICDMIVARGLKIELRLFNGIRVTDVYPELLAKMKKAGFTAITYALESGSPKVLKNIKKAITVEQAMKAVEMTKEVGIETTCNFIIGHPGETYEDALMTLEAIKNVKADRLNINNSVVYPATELYEWVSKNARFTLDVEEYLNLSWPGKSDFPFFETDDFTVEQRKEILRKAILLFREKIIRTRVKEPFASIYVLASRSNFLYSIGEILKTRPFVNKYVKPLLFRKYGVNLART